MQTNFNLDNFISLCVTKRLKSLLADDFRKYNTELNSRINGKRVLVIGGAGTIGSSYIKAILKFNINLKKQNYTYSGKKFIKKYMRTFMNIRYP